MRNAHPPRQLPQADVGWAVLRDVADRRLEQSAPQIAVTGTLAAVAGLTVAGTNVARAASRASTFAGYWQARMSEPAAANAIHLVALGDSSVEAIGADEPMDGFVGRITRHVAAKTGRPVHISNLASGVDTAGVIREQLPRAGLASADIVIVANSSDLESRVPIRRYRAALAVLMAALPADRTVYSDLPLMPGRGAYQRALEEATNSRGIRRADFASVFKKERRLDIFPWLPPHLNSRGYSYWFEAFQPAVDVIVERLAAPGRVVAR